MPVVPYSSDLFKTYKDVYKFLSDCQQRAVTAQQTQLVNVSFNAEAVSPILAALAPWQILSALDQPQQTHFYYSHQRRSIIALGTTLISQAQGLSCFSQVQQFVNVWGNRTVCYRPSLVGACPYFFCGFTFFSKATADTSFAPAQVFVPELQITQAERTTLSFNCLIDDSVNVAGVVESISERLNALSNLVVPADTSALPSQKVINDIGDFKGNVAHALKVMPSISLKKVVLADALEVLAAAPFQIGASLRSLTQNYPDCHVFSFRNGSGPAFVGASPERLLSVQDGLLLTDALAGSARRGQSAAEDREIAERLLANPKERYEHQVVVDFIVRGLRSRALNPTYSSTPTILPLANIQHLHTPIRAHLDDGINPLTLLEQLHPTPAVAGLPRAAACDLIRQTESFDRGLYAAPLGWVDTAGNSQFVVGIRSALLNGRQARIYAGAGIVSQSDPARELAEVRLKLQAMLGSLV